MSLPIVALISGNGSNLQAIIDAGLDIDIKAVISNQAQAYGLQRAKAAGIVTHTISHRDFASREAFDLQLQTTIDQYAPKLIVLAGFMRRLTPAFVKHFAGHIINIHPSLLPKYRGLDTHRRALEAGDTEHGCSIHYVTAALDGGPVIAQSKFTILAQETETDLIARVQTLEHALYPSVIAWFVQERLSLDTKTPLHCSEKNA